MKNLKLLNQKALVKIASLSIFTLISSLTFSACGGGGDSGNFSNAQTIIPIDVNCTTPATIPTYIALQSGDVIEVASGTPTVITYHDTNGTKRICLDSSSVGTANIIRK